jgi:hypothetical protein
LPDSGQHRTGPNQFGAHERQWRADAVSTHHAAPVYAVLTNIQKQIAARNRAIKAINDQYDVEWKRIQLQRIAGLINDNEITRRTANIGRARYEQLTPLNQQIGALKLYELNLRQQYGIPDVKAGRKK